MNAERNIEEFKPPRELREARTTRTAHEVLGGATVGVLGQIASDPGSERAQVFIDREGGGSPVVVEARWEGDRLDRGRQEMAARLLPQFEAAWNNNWQFFLTQSEKRRLQAEKNNQGVAASLKGNGLVRARKAMEDTERLMGEIDLRSRLPNLEVPRAPSRGSDIPPVDERKNGAALNMALGAGLLSASGAKKELKGLRGVLAVVTVAASLAGCRPTPTPRPEPGPTSEIQPIVYEPPATREAPRVERVTLQNQSTVTIINADIIEGLSIGGEKLPTLTPEGGGEGAALPRPLEELVRLNWGEDFIGKGETLTLVQALEAYVSAVGSAGVEKAEATTIDLARSYPGLRGPEGDRHLRFFRGQIVKDRGWEEVLTEVVPRQATLKNGVGIIVTGRYHQGLGEGEIIIGFNDWVYLDESGQLVSRDVPRISFAVIKEKDLPRLLQMINPAITYQDGMIAFPGTTEDGQKVIYEWFINTYSQEAYLEVVKKAGLEYISTAEVPVVPHPSEEQMKLLPEGSQYSHDKGIRGYFAPGPDGVLGEKAILTVEYDSETKQWVWERVGGVSKNQEREGKLATGQEYILVTREEGIELLEKPENKGKIILFGGPSEKARIIYYKSSDKRFLVMTVIGLSTSNIYVPTNGEFSVGEAVGYPIGIMVSNNITVYFGLSDEEKLNLDVGGKSGSLGKYVYGHATKLDLFKDHRELGNIDIEAIVNDGEERTVEEVERYFNEKLVLKKGNKLVFLETSPK